MGKSFFATVIVALLSSMVVQASCIESYTSAIAELKQKQKKAMGSSAALSVAMMVFPPAGIAKLGVYSARGLLTYDGSKRYIQITDLTDMRDLIRQAAVGQGEQLDFIFKVAQEEIQQLSLQDIAKQIVNDNADQLYCAENNLSGLIDVLVSLGVSEKLAYDRARFFSRKQAPNPDPDAINPLVGY